MNKTYAIHAEPDGALTPDDLTCINRFTRKTLREDEVYTFPVVLCDNEIDRDGERFDCKALETLAALFVGKSGLFDHSMQSRDQTARIYKAECRTDETRLTRTGEAYTYVRAMAYMPRTEKNRALIEEIDAGIKKEVSVGCAVDSITCSVCGADVRRSPCAHHKGEIVNGQRCHHVLQNPTDAYEWSFVAVPAQQNAGVTKSYQEREEVMQDILMTIRKSCGSLTLGEQELSALRDTLDALEQDAALGKRCREELAEKTLRLGLAAMPDVDGGMLKTVCGKLDVEELSALEKGFTKLAQRRIPMKPQLLCGETPSEPDSAFLI